MDEHADDKSSDKLGVYFAEKFDFEYSELGALVDLFDDLRDFAHHLTENHYYSDSINKKVMTAIIDLNVLSLKISEISSRGDLFKSRANAAILAKKQPAIDATEFQKLKKDITEARQALLKVHTNLQTLVNEIKSEYGKSS